jgi:hypothetical protein
MTTKPQLQPRAFDLGAVLKGLDPSLSNRIGNDKIYPYSINVDSLLEVRLTQKEIDAIMEAHKQIGNDKYLSPMAKKILRFVLLFGCRNGHNGFAPNIIATVWHLTNKLPSDKRLKVKKAISETMASIASPKPMSSDQHPNDYVPNGGKDIIPEDEMKHSYGWIVFHSYSLVDCLAVGDVSEADILAYNPDESFVVPDDNDKDSENAKNDVTEENTTNENNKHHFESFNMANIVRMFGLTVIFNAVANLF